jgi:hypothetical protein
MANRPTNRGFSGTSGTGELGGRLVAQEVAELAAWLTPDPAATRAPVAGVMPKLPANLAIPAPEESAPDFEAIWPALKNLRSCLDAG